MKKSLLLVLLAFNISYSQISIQTGINVNENFNSLGTLDSASLPTNWKIEKNNNVRTVGRYSGALKKTNYAGGINLSSTTGNGIYNFEVGNGTTPTDRAIGGISSGSGSKSVNIFAFFKNDGTTTIKQVDISYEVMRFRNGSNSAGFSIQLYYSKNGTTWITAGDKFISSFTPNADNNGAAVVPIEKKQILNQTLGNLVIAPSDSLFLAWNYSVTSGAITSNAQALGIDNFEMNNISAGGTDTAPLTPKSKAATNISSKGFTANWESSIGATNYFLDVSTSLDFSSFVSGFSNMNAGNTLSKDVSGLLPNTKYYYRVRAANAIGTSNSSEIVSITTSEVFTIVQFKGMSDAVSKMKGSYNLALSIANPSSTSATTCTVYFVADSSSASSSYLNNFTSQTVTFPVGSLSDQSLTITIPNDGISEVPKKAYLRIQTVNGGISAKVGNQAKFILSVTSGIDKEYYSNITGNLSGTVLKDSLYRLIKKCIKYFYTDNSTPNSIDVWKMLKAADEDPKNPNNVIGIYSGLSIGKEPQSYWNREHVWSKSHGNFGTDIGAGTDAHHLRPENPSINGLKSNLDFDMGGSIVPGATTNKYDSDSWEPRDEVKGDIARTIFYMAVRYEGENGEPDLEVVDYIPSSPNNEPKYGKLNTLLKWNLQDPPDDAEINRNNVVYSFQKNRNPFVDYPNWVTTIWGNPTDIKHKKKDEIIYNYSLNQNYPNPFNP
ncbi:MAG: endonuclease, partial [Ignavibacteria bacterium]|nr:endonuclease [Ignavibacteria bacterium]